MKVSSVRRLIENWFLKQRLVLAIGRHTYTRKPTECPHFVVERLDTITDSRDKGRTAYRFLAERLGDERVDRRLAHPGCAAFVAFSRETAEPVGFYWAIVPSPPGMWHDRMFVSYGSGLAFHGYVLESHRRRGVYGLLQAAVHNYLLVEKKCETAYTIVESANVPSLRANERFGLTRVSTNYLIKFLKRNLVSVYRSNGDIRFYYVASGAARTSL